MTSMTSMRECNPGPENGMNPYDLETEDFHGDQRFRRLAWGATIICGDRKKTK